MGKKKTTVNDNKNAEILCMFLSSSEVELYILTEVLGLHINTLAVVKDVQRHTLSSGNVARARIHEKGNSI